MLFSKYQTDVLIPDFDINDILFNHIFGHFVLFTNIKLCSVCNAATSDF